MLKPIPEQDEDGSVFSQLHPAPTVTELFDKNMIMWIISGVIKLGVPAVLAMFLTYSIINLWTGDLADMKLEIRNHIIESGYYMRQICINTAMTEGQRAQCMFLRDDRELKGR